MVWYSPLLLFDKSYAMPPLALADGDNDDYDDGEEDNDKGETSEMRATILHCVFRDFCRPPPSIGCALTALLRWGEQQSRRGCHGGVGRR